MTTKFRRRNARVSAEIVGTYIVVWGESAGGQKFDPIKYTETTKSLNELFAYYLEICPLCVHIYMKVAVLPPTQRAGWNR